MSYKTLLLDKKGLVSIITLNRPEALNAFNNQLMDELTTVLKSLEKDDGTHVIVLTGSNKAFAAGADINEMAPLSHMDAYLQELITANWEEVTRCKKPVIAAVAGYALGGGCELAMMCDFIICADNAKFGQPEIKLGVIPGAGGSQRLTRFIGKSKAMDMILTGRMMKAEEAERSGLVSRVFPVDDLMDEVLKIANTIAEMSLPSVMIAKEAVDRAYETPMADGILFERRTFHGLFSTEDQAEGMNAFLEKRLPKFKNK